MLLWILFSLLVSAQTTTETRPLSIGIPMERDLTGGQAHSYQLSLLAEQYLHVTVEQRGIDVAITLFAPDGKKLIEVDSPSGSSGEEVLAWVTNVAGNYRVEVRALENDVAPLGLRYNEMGAYVKAEPLYQRAIEIREKALGKDHPFLATTLSNLAALYADKGDLVKAVPLQLRAIAIKEKAFGNEHPDLARSFNLLAGFYREQGNYADSEKLHQRALAMREKIYGEHPETALSLFSFAKLYQLEGKAQQSEQLYSRSLTMLEKTVGGEHPYVVQALEGLAGLYNNQGKAAEAEALYNRALKIQQKTLNADAPDLARTLSRLATVSWAKGEAQESIAQLTRAIEISERNLSRNLLFGSERQKLSYLQLFFADTNNALSLHAQAAPRDKQALELAVTTLLRRKGRGLDAMTDSIAALRRRAEAGDQAKFTRLAELRSRIATLTLRGADDKTLDRTQLQQLEATAEQLEAELSTRSAEFRSQT